MKTVALSIAIATVSFPAMNAFGQASCASGAGAHIARDIASRSEMSVGGPSAEKVAPSTDSASGGEAASAISSVIGAPSVSSARFTVVETSRSNNSEQHDQLAPPAARLTVVADSPSVKFRIEDVVASSHLETTTKEAGPVVERSVAREEDLKIADTLKGLVGTWTAVARHGDGELTTVELLLDDRGWAKLILPGADGKPATIKRRVELEDDNELKLTGPDATTSLGTLIDFNQRQMILARADGQITFVRR